MFKKLLFLVVLFSISILESTCLAKTLDEPTKRFIYEITSPGIGKGTGFTVSDSLLGFVLVTCKHVVQDKKGVYADSIYLRRNKLLPTGEAISDTSQFVVRLKAGGLQYIVEHPNPDVDLIMVPLLQSNTTLSANESPYGLYSRVVLSKERMKEKGIGEGTDVEVIGFSLRLPKNRPHYHFSRFGNIGLYTTDEFTLIIDSIPRTANFILLDMTTRPGDSGSPVFAHIRDKTYLIGFISAASKEMEYGIAYPVYYLHDLMQIIRDKFKKHK